MAEYLKIAELSEEDVSKIVVLEKEMGFQIMAFEAGGKMAEPTDEQLDQIRNLEKELDVTLLAYQA